MTGPIGQTHRQWQRPADQTCDKRRPQKVDPVEAKDARRALGPAQLLPRSRLRCAEDAQGDGLWSVQYRVFSPPHELSVQRPETNRSPDAVSVSAGSGVKSHGNKPREHQQSRVSTMESLLSSRTPTSRCRSATARRRVQARESPPGAGRAATGTRVALRFRPLLPARRRARP